MGLFGNNIRKIIGQIRKMSEYYSNDLKKDIEESFDDLQDSYKETNNVAPEFQAFVDELKPKLNAADASRLEAFTQKIAKLDHNARKGVDALYYLQRNAKRNETETRWELEELEMELT